MDKTELINKLLWLGYTSAEEGTEKRKEAVNMAHNLLDEYLEAINYTHCCKSDSDLLPSKEKLNFEDWLKLRKIVRISDDAFKWEGSKYTYYYVNDIYKQYLKN